jgi:hypothetical protein
LIVCYSLTFVEGCACEFLRFHEQTQLQLIGLRILTQLLDVVSSQDYLSGKVMIRYQS